MRTSTPLKEISIKSNKTFLLEYFTNFFHIYSNKAIEAFKKKNINNFSINNLNSLNFDYLFKNKNSNINNNNTNLNINSEINQNLFCKVKSEYSLNFFDDNKKIINDNNKLFDFNENINFSGDINYPKLNLFGSSSLNNLPNPEPIFNFKAFPSKSLSNSMQRISSLGNLNNISGVGNLNLTPLHQIGLLDIYMNNNLNSMNNMNQINNVNNMSLNSIKNSNPNLFNNSNNNLFQLNQDNLVKGTLLSPPPKYHFNLGKSTMIPVTDKNNTNFTFSNSIGDKNILNESEKNSTTLDVFNKKRKRDIKNKKLVFIAGDNKKEKKEKEKSINNTNNTNNIYNTDNTETPNNTQTINAESNDVNSDKSKKPRGSKFRGVSRNGNQWQVLIMVNKKKRYVGSYSKEEDAARAYDKVALQNHGSKAKTNFDYTKQEVEEILNSPQLLKLY